MSASDLFSQQLLSVTAYCWKKTIFVSQFTSRCNYHHLVILTMLTTSAFANPRWLLLQLPMLSVINWIKWRWGEEILFSSEGGFCITRMSLCPPVTTSIFSILTIYWQPHASKLLSLDKGWLRKLWSCEMHMIWHEDRTTTINFSLQRLIAPSCI